MQNGHASLITALQAFHWPVKAAAELARDAHIVPYDKRSTIFHAGETADLVYVLLSGEVKLQFDADHGAGMLVAIAHGGQMLGVFAPDGGPTAAARSEQLFSAQALSRCKVAIIPTARAAQALQQLPSEQLVRVLEHGREQWTRLCCRLLSFLTMNVRERLTHALAEIADSFGISDARGRLITLRLSHEDLAALVGASRPMVSKHLKELTGDGVLTKQQGRYLVLQPQPDRAADGDNGRAAERSVSRLARPVELGHARERSGGATARGSAASIQPRDAVRIEAKGPTRSTS
jgi:CRP/FNR family cyclic AMP-dependent transcriptional regulator